MSEEREIDIKLLELGKDYKLFLLVRKWFQSDLRVRFELLINFNLVDARKVLLLSKICHVKTIELNNLGTFAFTIDSFHITLRIKPLVHPLR